ncbi:hypothetical protein [Schumannella sp. 10F1B-5-1]|nr:hypothetical protein [Schumannella sp. 10F1B-5-1]
MNLRPRKGVAAQISDREGGPDMDNDSIDGYDIPVDPMDLLQCDSCQ